MNERESLAQVVYCWDTSESIVAKAWDELTEGVRDTWREAADAIMASEVWRKRHPQPTEGEPSDTQIKAALEAWDGKLHRDTAMRAALRAAWGVADQGKPQTDDDLAVVEQEIKVAALGGEA